MKEGKEKEIGDAAYDWLADITEWCHCMVESCSNCILSVPSSYCFLIRKCFPLMRVNKLNVST